MTFGGRFLLSCGMIRNTWLDGTGWDLVKRSTVFVPGCSGMQPDPILGMQPKAEFWHFCREECRNQNAMKFPALPELSSRFRNFFTLLNHFQMS